MHGMASADDYQKLVKVTTVVCTQQHIELCSCLQQQYTSELSMTVCQTHACRAHC
jgi:hypothetical protein